ncbi:MAG: hypothetical protein ABI862_21585, partial [Ilumatobacteraceae bacterium]
MSAVSHRADPDGALQPWQFFLLGGMLAATATVIVATGQSPANIIILSITVVAVSFVGLGAYRVLLPLVSPHQVETPSLTGGRSRLALEREKQLVLRSIKELEFDFAMKKMSQADFDEMGARLRRRALGLMRQLDAGGGYREQIEKEVEKRLKDHPSSEGEGFSPRQTATVEGQGLSPGQTAAAKAIAIQDAACSSCGT